MQKSDLIEKIKEEDEIFIFELQKDEEKMFQELYDEDLAYTTAQGEVRLTKEARELVNKDDQEKERNLNLNEKDDLKAHELKQNAEEALEDLQNLKRNQPILREIYMEAQSVYSFAKEGDFSWEEKKRLYRLVNDLRFYARKRNEFSEPIEQ